MSTIWLINQYASTPDTGFGGRHHYLARELAKLGHRVFVIGAAWHHLLRDRPSDLTEDTLQIYGYTFVRVPVPPYGTAHSKGRIRNWFMFRRRLWKLRKILPRADAIVYSSPGLVAYPTASRLARHYNARLAFEVRDIWPLSLIELGGKSPRHPFVRYLQRIEKRAYATCDVALSNLSHAEEHMLEHGLAPGKFAYIPNGISLSEVTDPAPLDPRTLAAIPQGKFIIGYTGTLGVANRMDVLIDAAAALRDHKDIAFVVVGDGKDKAALKAQVNDLGLDSVTFLNAIPKNQMQSILALFNVNYVGSTAAPIYRFGIAANKLYDYMYAAQPLLLSYSGVGDPVTAYDAGYRVDAENSEALAEAILALRALPQKELENIGKRARAAVLDHYEYGALAVRLDQALFGTQHPRE